MKSVRRTCRIRVMKWWARLFVACAIGAGTAPAFATTITFDEIDTSATGIAKVSDEFASLGVKFSFLSGDGVLDDLTIVSDSLFGNGAVSQPNSAAFGFHGGVAIATFVDPLTGADAVTDFFSANVGDRSGETDPIVVVAVDLAGNAIGTASFTSQPTNVLGNNDFGLVTLALAGIHQLLFVDKSPSGADFDNFTFNPVKSGGNGTPVPEPATTCLLTGGLLAMVPRGLRRRRAELPYRKCIRTPNRRSAN